MGQDGCPIQNLGPAWSIDQSISKWSANKAECRQDVSSSTSKMTEFPIGTGRIDSK